MKLRPLFFIFLLIISNICCATYSAEYNALWPESLRPKKSPEWWKDGMGYKSRYWPQCSYSPECRKNNGENCGDYKYEKDSPIFIRQSKEFLRKLQTSLHKDDKRAFAALISYPLLWTIADNYYMYLHTEDQVIYHYDAIINKHMKKILLSIKAGDDMAPSLLMSNSLLSIIVAEGSMWLQFDMKIYVIHNEDKNLKAAKIFRKKHPQLWYPDYYSDFYNSLY